MKETRLKLDQLVKKKISVSELCEQALYKYSSFTHRCLALTCLLLFFIYLMAAMLSVI